MDADKLLDKVAQSMGVKIVTWTDVNNAINKNISFGMLVNIDRYLTEEEKAKLKEKNFIG